MVSGVSTALVIIQLVLACGNLCIMLFALYKFLASPRTSLEKRVVELEVEIKNIKDSLAKGNDQFRMQNKMNKAIFNVMLAFIDFEIAYCHNTGYKDNEDLIKAKDAIQTYLTDFE